MSDTVTDNVEFADAKKAICSLASNSWFDDLTPDWQAFLVSHTVETFKQYDVTMEQASQKLIEFYVEITASFPEAESMNPWESTLPSEEAIFIGD